MELDSMMISSHVLQSFFYNFHHFPQPLLPQLGPSMHSPGKRLLEQCHSRVLAEESHQLRRWTDVFDQALAM